MGDVVGGDVSRQMVYRHKGLSGGERQPLGKIHSHQQCADESGVRRHGNTVQLRQRHAGIVQRFLHHRQHIFAVPAGGNLRHNAAVQFMFLHR